MGEEIKLLWCSRVGDDAENHSTGGDVFMENAQGRQVGIFSGV
jgi:hypothetical protein